MIFNEDISHYGDSGRQFSHFSNEEPYKSM